MLINQLSIQSGEGVAALQNASANGAQLGGHVVECGDDSPLSNANHLPSKFVSDSNDSDAEQLLQNINHDQ